MRLRMRMIHPSDYKIAGVAMFFGLCAQQVMAAWLALPWAAQTFLQGLITLGIGACTLVVGHFLRRFLNRHWPIEAPAQNVATTRGAALGKARFDLFDLFRRGMSRLRRSKRRRQEP
jgi:hypothetical protein